MIIKTVEQLNTYLADGGDPDRVSIKKDPLPVVPDHVVTPKGEGRHHTSTYEHKGGYYEG